MSIIFADALDLLHAMKASFYICLTHTMPTVNNPSSIIGSKVSHQVDRVFGSAQTVCKASNELFLT